jgi:hypothetical protein
MADNNIHTRAKERARIRSVIAANEAAIANARVSTAAIQPLTTTASSTAQPSAPAAPTTAAQPSPSNRSAGKRRLVYNPDIDSDTEECINVLPRPDPPTRTQKVSRSNTNKAIKSTSGPTNVETGTPAQAQTSQLVITNGKHAVSTQRNSEHNIEPTPSSSGTTNVEHQVPTQTTTVRVSKKPPAPETDAPINITSLALEDRPDADPGVPPQPLATPEESTEQSKIRPAYPDVPPEVPVDEEGIREYCNPLPCIEKDLTLRFVISDGILLKTKRQGADLGEEIGCCIFHRPGLSRREMVIRPETAVVVETTPWNHKGLSYSYINARVRSLHDVS